MKSFPLIHAASLPLLLALTFSVKAADGISYGTPGSTYFEDFDSLPIDAPNNANIETVYVNGWVDDSTTVANTSVGVPGWYLYHPIEPGATPPALPENGSNGHQRFRFGPAANTGSFWAFGSHATTPEKALGSIGSTTIAANNANMYMALRLVNNTGITLGSFTITFDGEQWRDGTSSAGETLSFAYSLTALPTDWNTTSAFTAVPALDLTSPVVGSTTGAQVNGNVEGLIQDISATISNISWAPGAELWLRWSDPQLPSFADDGLAIDNFSFTAAGIPDPGLKFGRNGSGQLQLEWQGGAAYSWQFQHSDNLQSWTSPAAAAPETDGPMTYVIPADLLDDGRRYFRLRRATLP